MRFSLPPVERNVCTLSVIPKCPAAAVCRHGIFVDAANVLCVTVLARGPFLDSMPHSSTVIIGMVRLSRRNWPPCPTLIYFLSPRRPGAIRLCHRLTLGSRSTGESDLGSTSTVRIVMETAAAERLSSDCGIACRWIKQECSAGGSPKEVSESRCPGSWSPVTRIDLCFTTEWQNSARGVCPIWGHASLTGRGCSLSMTGSGACRRHRTMPCL